MKALVPLTPAGTGARATEVRISFAMFFYDFVRIAVSQQPTE